MTSLSLKAVVPLLTTILLACLHGRTVEAAENCTIHTGELTWVYEGYPIVFEGAVARVLSEKNYVIAHEEAPATYQLEVKLGTERGRYFDHATAAFVFTRERDAESGIHSNARKRCFTEFCPVDHFLPPLRKIVKEMERKIPRCVTLSGAR